MSAPESEGEFGRHILAVATELWGQPRTGGSPKETRFGEGRTINQIKGSWWVHGTDIGGGVLDLIVHEGRATDRGGAASWMREHGHLAAASPNVHQLPPRARIVETYVYTDEEGEPLYRVHRWEVAGKLTKAGKQDKFFSQERFDQGQWVKGPGAMDGVPRVLYRLPEVLAALAEGEPIVLVEGERKADRLCEKGIIATCNVGGAGNWKVKATGEWIESYRTALAGSNVIIVPDNDEAGRKHVAVVGEALHKVAASLRVLELPGLGEKEDVVDWLANGGKPQKFVKLMKAAPLWLPAPYQSNFGLILYPDFGATPHEYEWLVEDVLPSGEMALTFGAPQTGKSFDSLDMAFAISRGVPWHGYATKQAGVIYCAFEGGKGILRRIEAYQKANGVDPEVPLDLAVVTKRADLFASDEDCEKLLADFRHAASTFQGKLGLITLDTWSAATPGANENASQDVSRIRQRMIRIATVLGAELGHPVAILIIHHKPAGGGKPRGHSSFAGDMETTIDVDWAYVGEGKDAAIRRDRDGRRIRMAKLTKQREGEIEGKDWEFVLARVPLGQDRNGKAIGSCVVAKPNVEAQKSDERFVDKAMGGERMSPDGRWYLAPNILDAMTALAEAIKRQGRRPDADIRAPAGAEAVTKRQWREEYERLKMTGEETAEELSERVRKARDRAEQKLRQAGFIAMDRDWCWRTGKRVFGIDPPELLRRAVESSTTVEDLINDNSDPF